MTWRVEIGPNSTHLLVEVLNAQSIWRKLSKPAQAAVQAAMTENILVYAHPLTIKSLERRGFVVGTAYSSRTAVLTEAGKAVAKWNMPKP